MLGVPLGSQGHDIDDRDMIRLLNHIGKLERLHDRSGRKGRVNGASAGHQGRPQRRGSPPSEEPDAATIRPR